MSKHRTAATSIVLAACTALAAVPAAASAKAPAPMLSCLTVRAADTHGGTIRPNSTLSPIRDGKVLTISPDTGKTSHTPFTSRSGRWLTGVDGTRYAVAGQWLTPSGRPGGRRLIASPPRFDNRLLCSARTRVGAHAADTASYASDGSLGGGGYLEVNASTTNVSGIPVANYATRNVCTVATAPAPTPPAHPDGANLASSNPHPDPATWCWTGAGAGMNDTYGNERYAPAQGGTYIDDPYHRHFISYTSGTVAAAKRPLYYPGTCRIIPGSKIAWRTVYPACPVAN
jgi:hypothetical protein